MPTSLPRYAKTLDHRFLVFVLRLAFFFLLAARMLSTRLGWRRPAFLAERSAAALRAGASFLACPLFFAG
jgi:hypothetical protein